MEPAVHTGLTSIGTLFTNFMTWVGEIITEMTKSGNEILLIGVGIFVIGAVIGLAHRLIGR